MICEAGGRRIGGKREIMEGENLPFGKIETPKSTDFGSVAVMYGFWVVRSGSLAFL